MTILDVLKERILELKNRILLSPNYAKIIDLIPDSETIDSYYQDTYTGKWLLKAGMAINQVPILDANRNLLVESPNYVEYELEIKVIDGAHEHITPIELTFLADSISINAYAVGSDHSCMIFIYYLFTFRLM